MSITKSTKQLIENVLATLLVVMAFAAAFGLLALAGLIAIPT